MGLRFEPSSSKHFSWLLGCLGIALATLSGCASRLRSIETARQSFVAGDLTTARETLDEIARSRGRFAEPASLDLAIVELAAGDVDAAEKRLRTLRDAFDRKSTVDPAGETISIVTDDTARVFRPAGYEEVMIRSLLAVCSLASDQIDAESYALQAIEKQAELKRLAEERGIGNAAGIYQPIALAPYLRGVLREATHRHYDDAERAYRLVSQVEPAFAPAQSDIERASGGQHSQPGHGVLYVIAGVGRGPVLQEAVAATTSEALSIASAVVNVESNKTSLGDRDRSLALPNLASVKVPKVVIPRSDIAAVGVEVDGKLRGGTQTLTDIARLAQQQNEAEMPWTIARAIVRRASKEAAVSTARDQLGLEGAAGSVFHFAAASLWSGAENADTRCWGLLPREFQVFRMQLPAGVHRIALQPLSGQGRPIAAAAQQDIEIFDGRNTYLMAVAPDRVVYTPKPAARSSKRGN